MWPNVQSQFFPQLASENTTVLTASPVNMTPQRCSKAWVVLSLKICCCLPTHMRTEGIWENLAYAIPVDGVWDDWTEWGHCNVTCGGGWQLRTRVCEDPKYGGAPCPGSDENRQTCNDFHCASKIPSCVLKGTSITHMAS